MKRKRKPTYNQLLGIIEKLEAKIVELENKLTETQNKLADTEAKLAAANKDSRNSSKPPSSDIVKPKKKNKHGTKNSIGGQTGHKKPEDKLTTNDADNVVEFHADILIDDPLLELVPDTEHPPKIIYQYEFVEKPVELTAYVSYPYRDLNSGDILYAPLPHEVEMAGILGPRLSAFAACLKGGIHSSYTGVEKILCFLGADVCRATICNKIMKVADALACSTNELLQMLPTQPHLNIDESGHKDNPFDKPDGHPKHWIWVFVASTFTVFRIFRSRSTDVLREVLGKNCAAIIGSDFYSSYKCFMKEANIKVQFCWAHLIRDIKFLSESSDKVTSNYGKRLLKLCRLIFHLQRRRGELGEERFRRRMLRLKDKFLSTGRSSQASGAVDMVVRLKDFGEEYFLFLEHPEIEPTNNLAEQEIRHCVIDRRITQGTRGEAGQRWCERIWTVLATCARQKRNAFEFIAESVYAYYNNLPQPSLLPA